MQCNQDKCSFKKGFPYEGMCPICSECGAEPHVINDNCVNCWNCLKDEGYIRSGVPKGSGNIVKEKVNEKEQVIERQLK